MAFVFNPDKVWSVQNQSYQGMVVYNDIIHLARDSGNNCRLDRYPLDGSSLDNINLNGTRQISALFYPGSGTILYAYDSDSDNHIRRYNVATGAALGGDVDIDNGSVQGATMYNDKFYITRFSINHVHVYDLDGDPLNDENLNFADVDYPFEPSRIAIDSTDGILYAGVAAHSNGNADIYAFTLEGERLLDSDIPIGTTDIVECSSIFISGDTLYFYSSFQDKVYGYDRVVVPFTLANVEITTGLNEVSLGDLMIADPQNLDGVEITTDLVDVIISDLEAVEDTRLDNVEIPTAGVEVSISDLTIESQKTELDGVEITTGLGSVDMDDLELFLPVALDSVEITTGLGSVELSDLELATGPWVPWPHEGVETFAQIADLDPNTKYDVRIRATREGIDPSTWYQVAGGLRTLGVLLPPTNLAHSDALSDLTRLGFTWDPNEDGDVPDGWEVQYRNSSN